MDKIMEQLIAQSPSMAAIVMVVFVFLKAMGKRDKFIQTIYDEGNIQRNLTRDVLEKNTVAATLNTAALNNVAHKLDGNTQK